MGALSPTHLLIVIGIAVVLFGAKRLPEAARGLGHSARILKAELHATSPGEQVPTGPAPGSPADTPAPTAPAGTGPSQ